MWFCFVNGAATFYFLNGRQYKIGRRQESDCAFPDLKFLSRDHILITFVHRSDLSHQHYSNDNPDSPAYRDELVRSFVSELGSENRPTLAKIDCLGQTGCLIDTFRTSTSNEGDYTQTADSITITKDQKDVVLDKNTSRFIIHIKSGSNHLQLDFRWMPMSLIVGLKKLSSSSPDFTQQQELRQQREKLLELKQSCYRIGFSLIFEDSLVELGKKSSSSLSLSSSPDSSKSSTTTMMNREALLFAGLGHAFNENNNVGALITDDPTPNPFVFCALCAKKPIIAFQLITKYVEDHLAKPVQTLTHPETGETYQTPSVRIPVPTFGTIDALFPPKILSLSQDAVEVNAKIERHFDDQWNRLLSSSSEQSSSSSASLPRKYLQNRLLPDLDQNKGRFSIFDNNSSSQDETSSSSPAITFVTIQESVMVQLKTLVDLCQNSKQEDDAFLRGGRNDDDDEKNRLDADAAASSSSNKKSSTAKVLLDKTIFHKSGFENWIRAHTASSSSNKNETSPHILVVSSNEEIPQSLRKTIMQKMSIVRVADIYRSIFEAKRQFLTFDELVKSGALDSLISSSSSAVSAGRQQQRHQREEEDDIVDKNKSSKQQQQQQQQNPPSQQFSQQFGAKAAELNTKNLFVNDGDNNNTNNESQQPQQGRNNNNNKNNQQQQLPQKQNVLPKKNNNLIIAQPKIIKKTVNDKKNEDFPQFDFGDEYRFYETDDEVEARRNVNKMVVDDGLLIMSNFVAKKGGNNTNNNNNRNMTITNNGNLLPDFPCFRPAIRRNNQNQNQRQTPSQKTFKKQNVPSRTSNNMFGNLNATELFEINTSFNNKNNTNNQNPFDDSYNGNDSQQNNNNNIANRRMNPLSMEERRRAMNQFTAKRIDGDDIIPDDLDDGTMMNNNNPNNNMMMMMGEINPVMQRRSQALDYCYDHRNANFNEVISDETLLADVYNRHRTVLGNKGGKTAALPAAPAPKRKPAAKKSTAKKSSSSSKKKTKNDDDDDDLVDFISEDDSNPNQMMMMMDDDEQNSGSSKKKGGRKASPKKAAAPRGKKASGSANSVSTDAAPSIFDVGMFDDDF